MKANDLRKLFAPEPPILPPTIGEIPNDSSGENSKYFLYGAIAILILLIAVGFFSISQNVRIMNALSDTSYIMKGYSQELALLNSQNISNNKSNTNDPESIPTNATTNNAKS